MGVEISMGRGNFGGCLAHWKASVVSAVVYAAKGIIQSSMIACSTRDHWILNSGTTWRGLSSNCLTTCSYYYYYYYYYYYWQIKYLIHRENKWITEISICVDIMVAWAWLWCKFCVGWIDGCHIMRTEPEQRKRLLIFRLWSRCTNVEF